MQIKLDRSSFKADEVKRDNFFLGEEEQMRRLISYKKIFIGENNFKTNASKLVDCKY